MEPGLVRAGRHTKDLGGLIVRETKVVVENEDGPELRRQPLKSAIDLIPVGEVVLGAGSAHRLAVDDALAIDPTPLAAGHPVGRSDEDSMDP